MKSYEIGETWWNSETCIFPDVKSGVVYVQCRLVGQGYLHGFTHWPWVRRPRTSSPSWCLQHMGRVFNLFQSVSICFDMFCMFYLSSLFLSSHSCKDFWSNLQSDHRENCKQIWFGLHFSLIRSSVVLVLGLLLLATCFFSLCQNLHRQSSRDEDHLEHRSITITCLASLFFPAHCSLPSTLVGILLVAGRCAFSSPDSIFF